MTVSNSTTRCIRTYHRCPLHLSKEKPCLHPQHIPQLPLRRPPTPPTHLRLTRRHLSTTSSSWLAQGYSSGGRPGTTSWPCLATWRAKTHRCGSKILVHSWMRQDGSSSGSASFFGSSSPRAKRCGRPSKRGLKSQTTRTDDGLRVAETLTRELRTQRLVYSIKKYSTYKTKKNGYRVVSVFLFFQSYLLTVG